jgi:hypothetical protein
MKKFLMIAICFSFFLSLSAFATHPIQDPLKRCCKGLESPLTPKPERKPPGPKYGIAHYWKPTEDFSINIDRQYGPAEWVDMYYNPELDGNVK